MRKKLKKIGNTERHQFVATIERIGYKRSFGYVKKTILLKDVYHLPKKRKITDHLWMNYGKQMEDLVLQPGDKISFYARVKKYIKGYVGYDEETALEHPISEDYCLERPTHIEKIK